MARNPLADPDCPQCGGEGFVFADSGALVPTVGRRCACLLRRVSEMRASERLAGANIPPKYANASFEGFTIRAGEIVVTDPDRGTKIKRPKAAFDRANRDEVACLAEAPLPPGMVVYLYGPYGAGKTYLGTALLRAQIIRHEQVGFQITTKEYTESLRPEILEPPEQRALRRRAREADVLLLDDLGAEKLTAFSLRELFDLLDHRWTSERATIITSNRPLKDVLFAMAPDDRRSADDERQVYEHGRRIFSRLAERIDLIGWPDEMPDFRLEKHADENAARVAGQRERRDSSFVTRTRDQVDRYRGSSEGDII